MNKFFLFLFVNLFLFSFASAFEFDNVISERTDIKLGDSYTIGDKVIPYNELWKTYKPIEIKNAFGLGETLYKDVLTKHSESCGGSESLCEDIWEVELTNEGALLDDMLYDRILEDGSRIKGNVRWNNFYYLGDVIDYKTECSPAKLTEEELKNETKPYDVCIQVESGSHEDWVQFNIGDKFKAGYYKVKSVAEKRPDYIIDYIPVVMGKPLVSRATWGNISLGSQAEVILNSPANNSIQYTNSVTTNSSANVTGGANLVNVTLYDNSTGSWGARNITDLYNIDVQGLVSYYTLDETSGTTVFDSMGLNNGTTTSTINANGKINKAYNFTANTQYISLGTPDSIPRAYNKPFTTCMWTYLYNNNSDTNLYTISGDSNSKFEIGMGTTNFGSNFIMGINKQGVAGYSAIDYSIIQKNQWYFICGSYDGTGNTNGIKLYVNSINTANATYGGGNLVSSTTAVGIGNSMRFTTGAITGLVDEVGIWNKSLSQSEITALYNSGAGSRPTTNTTTTTTTFTNSYPAGSSIKWNYQYCDTDGDCGFAPQNFTFSVDGTAPTITLNYPTALIDYGKLNGTLQLNFTATDTNLDKVWYNYNGTNVTIAGATSGVANLSNITLSSKKNVTIYANDTAGNLNTTTFSWDYTLFETSRTFNASTFTTAEEPFTLNITTDGSQIPIAYLVYNGTSYLATRTGNLTNPMFSNSITMTNTGNMSFYWSILWGSQVINTSTSYQQVTAVTAMNITSSACSAGLTKVANFTFANEVNFTALTGATVNYNFKYGIANSTGLVSAGTLTNVSVFNVCLNLTQSANYTIGYGEVQYSNDGYSDRRFYLFENTRYSNNTITNVLYSLPNANSYSFLFEARTPALNVYSDKYVSLLRWYPNINDYKIVEMGKTDQKGQTVFKVKTEDVDYRIGIYERDGTLIYLANPIRMVCLVSPCSYTLTVRTTEGYSYDNRLQVQNELTYNNGTFTFTYNDPSQATDLMRLVVYSMSGTDETQICEDNSTSFTAILSCNVSSTTGVLKAVAYRTASPEFPLATLIIDTLTTIFQGTFGLFLQFLLTTTLILAGLISPVVAIILGILSLLIGVLVFKTISISIAIGIGILGAIVIHFIKRQGTI